MCQRYEKLYWKHILEKIGVGYKVKGNLNKKKFLIFEVYFLI